MKRISIISALLLAVLMAGCAAATAPCETQTPELPPQAEAAMGFGRHRGNSETPFGHCL